MDNQPQPEPIHQSSEPKAPSFFQKFKGWRSRHLEFCRITLPLYVIALFILIASGIIAGTFIYTQNVALKAAYGAASQQGSTATAAQQQQTPAAGQPVNVSAVSTTNDPYIGNPNAPVTIAFWSDYQCPFCQQFELTILPQIVTQYVDTGKVRIVFKDFQFLGPDSLTAAEIARAVWQAYPSKFWAWRQAMYQNQGPENHNPDPNGETTYLNVTKTIPGININTIKSLLAQNKTAYDAAINADLTEGEKFGINGTPSFIVGNGNPLVVGGGSLTQFTQLIDAQLAK